tara:strand:- start:1460 stop:1738 length:279 start_codon:yes stop_codon:yes gene_type:complete
MKKSRRNFIKLTGLANIAGISASASGTTILNSISMNNNEDRAKISFFDINEKFLDLGPKKSVTAALGGKDELVSSSYTTMLQYSLVVTTGNR